MEPPEKGTRILKTTHSPVKQGCELIIQTEERSNTYFL